MKKLVLGLSLVLVLGLAVTGTLALFSNTTTEVTNTFTMGEGVSAELKEPSWDGVCFTDETCTPTTGELGKDTAGAFEPMDIITKDPQVKNTSKDTNVVVAVEITYGKVGSYAELLKFATIDFSNDWEFNATKTVAYYKGTVAPNAKTTPVFTNVTINADATSSTLKDFDIVVKGYVVQEDKTAGATVKNTINSVYPALNK